MNKLLPLALASSLLLFSCASNSTDKESKTDKDQSAKAGTTAQVDSHLDERSEKAYINEDELSEKDVIKTGANQGILMRNKEGKPMHANHERYKKPVVSSERLIKDPRTGRTLQKITPTITTHYQYDKNGKLIGMKRTPTKASSIFNPYSYDYTKKLEEFRTHSLAELTREVKTARAVDLPAIIEALSFKSKNAVPVLASLLTDKRFLSFPVHTKSRQPQYLWIDGQRGNDHIIEKIQVRTWAAFNLQNLLKASPAQTVVGNASDYYFASKGFGKEKTGINKEDLAKEWLLWWDLNSDKFQ